MGEIRQANFRIDETAAEAFRRFCEENGLSQAQGFDHMLQVLELDKAKTAIPSRQTEVTDFEAHAKALISAFLRSLELNENAEARVREEFIRELERKDQTITDYQEQLAKHKAVLDEDQAQIAQLRTIADGAAALERKVDELEVAAEAQSVAHDKQLHDKDSIIAMLTDKLAAAEKKAAGYDDLAADRDEKAAALKVIRDELRDIRKDAAVELERAARDAEKAMEAAVAAARAEAAEKADALRSELQRVQIEAERELRKAEKESATEIRKLESTIADLRLELAELRAGVRDGH